MRILALIALLVCLGLVACTNGQIEAALNTASSLAASASAVVSGLDWGDSAAKSAITASLAAISKFCSAAGSDLAQNKLTPLEIARLVDSMSGQIISNLPASVPPLVRTVLLAANAAVTAVIAILQSQFPNAATAAPGNNNPVKVHFTAAQAGQLRDSVESFRLAVKALRAGK